MTPFTLLSNKDRDARRPPRLVSRASAETIARLVPVRIQRRRTVKSSQPGSQVHESSVPARSDRKSPLPQAPVIVHFPTMSSRSLGPASNGNTKVRPISKQEIEPSKSTNTITKVDQGGRGESAVTSWHWREPSPEVQEIVGRSEPEKIIEDAPQKTNPVPKEKKQEDRIPETQPVLISPKPRLKELLAQYRTLPPQSVVLGICEDGLPLALDMNDPTPGALLAMGDERDEQIGLLRTAVASLCMRNTPRAAQFVVLSHQPESWHAWVAHNGYDRHCIAIENSQEDGLRERIIQLADWTEQRRLGQRSGPPILLVIDTLTFLPRLAYDIRLNFDWLVKEGPPARIWTIAAISTDLASSLGSRMLRSFQSRILGRTRDPGIYSRLVGIDEITASSFNQPGLFAVQVGDSWLKFHSPGNGI